ncbi:GAF domain-containing protein [Acuticoccus sp. M5D2P5]|uniref:GAF domain-containing protein n=1 Tax=Acuticoccus kalidii TaxID=2910977 RepID=UPI001F2061EF|nr:GAF domain-containing protein [Acuticoccus kalidii]MCF3936083.1 GAF domain-containing protein [Acuticoccus kalidii]
MPYAALTLRRAAAELHGDGSEEAAFAAPVPADFDGITGIAKQIFNCPTAVVSLVDPQANGSLSGAPYGGDRRAGSASFTACVIRDKRALVVENAAADSRFRENIMVFGFPFIRFYVGVPVFSRSGAAIGALCVIDYVSRPAPPASEISILSSLAALVGDQIERAVHELSRPSDHAQFTRVASTSANGVLEIDTDGHIVRSNRAARARLGVTAETLHAGRITDFVPNWPNLRAAHFLTYSDGGSVHAHDGVLVETAAADGSVSRLRATISSWLEGGHLRFRMVFDDPTE